MHHVVVQIRRLFALSLFISLLFTTPAYAQIVSMDISGTLGTNVFCCGTNNASNYPMPGLFTGSVFGTFSYDSGAGPAFPPGATAEFDFSSLNIEIRDTGGTALYTIDNSVNVNRMRVWQTGNKVILFFGQSGGLVGVPSDLRIILTGTFTTGSTPPTGAELAAATVVVGRGDSLSSLLEIDDDLGSNWDLDVTGAVIGLGPVPIQETTWGNLKKLFD